MTRKAQLDVSCLTARGELQRAAKQRELEQKVGGYLPTSPYISLHLLTSPYISLHLPTSPYISLHLPTSPKQMVLSSGEP